MAPASCCLTSMGGPLIDTRREVAQFGRAYLSPDIVREAAAVLGLIDEREHQALVERCAELEEELRLLREDEESVLVKYDALRASMAETMQHGFVVDRKGTIRYRQSNGSRAAKEE